MEPTTTEIIALTREVCGTMLAVALDELETGAERPPTEVMASVQISGDWQGAVVLLCSSELAHAATAAMFDTEVGATTQADLDDAMGELANMIGGNIKNRLPVPCKLSLPTVVCGAGVKGALPRHEAHHRPGLRAPRRHAVGAGAPQSGLSRPPACDAQPMRSRYQSWKWATPASGALPSSTAR